MGINVLNRDSNILKNNFKIAGVTPITIFSWSDTIGTTEQTVWRAAGDQAKYNIKYTAANCTIVSDDAEDGAGTQTGILTLRISGLDDNYEVVSEVVTLNGLTPVALTNQYLAINEMNPETAGSTKTAQGNIDVLYSDGDILARIPKSSPVSFNISYQAVFTVPKNLTLKINKFTGTSIATNNITANLYVNNPINQIPIIQETLLLKQSESNPIGETAITVPEKHTILVNATASLGTNQDLSVSIAGDLIVNSIFEAISEYRL